MSSLTAYCVFSKLRLASTSNAGRPAGGTWGAGFDVLLLARGLPSPFPLPEHRAPSVPTCKLVRGDEVRALAVLELLGRPLLHREAVRPDHGADWGGSALADAQGMAPDLRTGHEEGEGGRRGEHVARERREEAARAGAVAVVAQMSAVTPDFEKQAGSGAAG